MHQACITHGRISGKGVRVFFVSDCQVNVITYSSAINACAKRQKWEEATQLGLGRDWSRF